MQIRNNYKTTFKQKKNFNAYILIKFFINIKFSISTANE